MGAITFSAEGAPTIRRGLGNAPWSIPFHILTGAVALWAIWTIWSRQFRLARLLVPIQVTLIVFGWGLAQYPYLVTPDLTFSNTAAPDTVLRPVLIVLSIGIVLLVPAFGIFTLCLRGHLSERVKPQYRLTLLKTIRHEPVPFLLIFRSFLAKLKKT